MCIVKTPKLRTDPNANQPKDPTVIRNPYLDGVGRLANANRMGRASLRITRGSSSIRPSAPPIAAPRPSAPPTVAPPPGLPPVLGRGGAIPRGTANVY